MWQKNTHEHTQYNSLKSFCMKKTPKTITNRKWAYKRQRTRN